MMNHATLRVLTVSVLCFSLLLFCGVGCSTSNTFSPSGNPLLDLRNPELLERDRITAARQAWAEVESGVRVRDRTRKALKNLAWSNSTDPQLRLVVMELIMSDRSDLGQADSRNMARLMLPNERSPEVVRIMLQQAVENSWTELVPAIVRSYSKESPNVPDIDRDERSALLELMPNESLESILFSVFLNPTIHTEHFETQTDTNQSVATEHAVLRTKQRTRDDAWGVLARIDPSGNLRRSLLRSLDSNEQYRAADEVSISTVRWVAELESQTGIIPNTAQELSWLVNIHQHPDERNRRLNRVWLEESIAAVAALPQSYRSNLEMRHLEPIRWAYQHRPSWLEIDRQSLFGVASERLSKRVHYKRKHIKGELPRKERLSDWQDELSWADVLTILVVDDALQNPNVIDQIFVQRALDRKDTTTEYGGVIELSGDQGARAILYRPRSRDRIDDERFVASDDMYRFSDRSLVHYHMHVNKRDNGRYAGPSQADLLYAKLSGRSSMVITSVGKVELNVDLFFPNGVVIDLGQLVSEE